MKRQIYQSEHEIFRRSFRKYLKEKVIPVYNQWEDAGIVPREAWLDAGKQGFLCPNLDEKYGGHGGDFLYSAVIQEELFFHGLNSVFWGVHSDIVLPYIVRYASEEKKREWLPKTVSGELILAISMTEPEAGSDLASLKAEAVLEGDHYVVNGSKTFISNGQLADLNVVAVRTAETPRPHDGISLLVIESDREGYQKGRNLEKIGLHGQDTSEIFFNNCRVPVENLLGIEGRGFEYLMHNLQQERLVLSIGAYAAAKGAFEMTMDYVKNRKLFGRTIGDFQNTRFALAEMATHIQLAESFLDQLIIQHMAGENLVKEVSMAKYWITDLQFEVAHRCLQFFGGYGYMKETPISRFFLDARIQSIYGGANEVMKSLIAKSLLS